MILKYFSSVFVCLGLSLSVSATAEDNYTHPPKYDLHPEIDKTDTYAIPLDSTEEDEDQEMARLKQIQKEESKKTSETK